MDPPFAETRPIRRARLSAVLACLRLYGDRPVPAIELATACQAVGRSRETKRRRVRELIQELREDGFEICAGFDRDAPRDHELGYWLARGPEEWRRYLESRRGGARFQFAAVRRMHEAAVDRISGQSRFDFTAGESVRAMA